MKVSSINNNKIKFLRSLYRKKYRRLEGKFVLEGVRIIEEALKEGVSINQVFYSKYLFRNKRGLELLKRLEKNDIDTIETTDQIITEVADTESPQGILAIVDKVNFNLAQILSGNNKLVLIVDQIQDPGNLGTIIRTADAASIDGIITTKGTVSLYNQKTIRATMGSMFRVPVYRSSDLKELQDILKEEEFKVVVGDINGQKYHFEIDYTTATAIIVGNEGNGPREELINFADELIKIPLIGEAESLNVAMATGIITYEAVRQRMEK